MLFPHLFLAVLVRGPVFMSELALGAVVIASSGALSPQLGYLSGALGRRCGGGPSMSRCLFGCVACVRLVRGRSELHWSRCAAAVMSGSRIMSR